MHLTTVHLHKSKKHNSLNIALLLIPVMIFELIIASYLVTKEIYNQNIQLASGTSTSTNQTEVLGDTVDSKR
jgi:hypothetical protein